MPKLSRTWFRCLPVFLLAALVGACASSTKVTTTQALASTADAPYNKILVVALAGAFDPRHYLETEVVKQLKASGVDAVASTSMMDSRTPIKRQTFADMVEKIGADAVIVTQVISNEADLTEKGMRPEATINVWPTYYYNVWAVQQTEYFEPPGLALGKALVLATQVYSVAKQEPVWAIQQEFKVVQESDQVWDYSIFPDQARVISSHMARDGLLTR